MSLREPNETPTPDELISEAIEERLFSVNTIMPGTITEVDKERGLVTVRPDYLRRFRDRTTPESYPEIPGVPILNIRAGEAEINMPVAKGHKCLLLFSQRSLEKWKNKGEVALPGSSRLHHITDAICIPGLYPQSMKSPIGEALTIRFGKATLKLSKDSLLDVKIESGSLQMNNQGKFKLSNGTSDVLELLRDYMTASATLADEITKMTVSTALGPSGTVIVPAPFIQIGKDIQKLKKKLEQLILE